MKSSITTILVLLFVQLGITQKLQLGLRASYGYCMAKSEDQFLLTSDNRLEYKLSFMRNSSAKAVGLFMQKKVGFVFLQPEILYRTTESVYEMIDYESRDYNPHKMTEKTHQLHIPITAGMHFNNIRLGAGPVFNYLLDTESKMGSMHNISERRSSWDYGFQAGVGYDYKNLSLDLKYEWAFSKVGEQIFHENEKRAFSVNPNLINVSLGFRF